MLRRAREVLSGLTVVVAAASASTLTAHAFDKVQSVDPVPAGRGYIYYVREHDSDDQPLQGRTVTMSVQRAPGSDATVAPCDPQGHTSGSPAQTATQVSGADGLAYFFIRTATTPGENDFTWQDGTYSGQVIVIGKPVAAATATATAGGATGTAQAASTSASATPRAGAAGGSRRGGTGAGPQGAAEPAAARVSLPSPTVPPLAAALLATMLAWLFGPALVQRHEARLAQLARRLGMARLMPRRAASPR